MAGFTRLTLTGGSRRVDVVVASDVPLAHLMPRLAEVAGAPPDEGPYALVRPIGDRLDLALGCEENQVLDGEIISLVPFSETPAPPAVSDVTDLVAGVREQLPGVWGPRARKVVAVIFIVVLSTLWGLLFDNWIDMDEVTQVYALGLGSAACVVMALILGRLGRTWGCVVLMAAAAGPVWPFALTAADLGDPRDYESLLAATGVGALAVILGVGAGVGLKRREVQVAAVVTGVLALGGLLPAFTWLRPDQAWGIVIVIAVVILGLIPAWATTVSGLGGLDDFAAAGQPPGRDRVLASVDVAYKVTTWTVAGLAGLTGIGCLVMSPWDDLWGTWLVGVVVVILGLRSRTMPHMFQAGALWLAVLAGGVALVYDLTDWWQAVVLALAAAGAALAAVTPVPAHVRVRLRRIGDLVVKVAVAALVPLLIGLLGFYPELLGAFS